MPINHPLRVINSIVGDVLVSTPLVADNKASKGDKATAIARHKDLGKG